jgi:hypothetical protein
LLETIALEVVLKPRIKSKGSRKKRDFASILNMLRSSKGVRPIGKA